VEGRSRALLLLLLLLGVMLPLASEMQTPGKEKGPTGGGATEGPLGEAEAVSDRVAKDLYPDAHKRHMRHAGSSAPFSFFSWAVVTSRLCPSFTGSLYPESRSDYVEACDLSPCVSIGVQILSSPVA
jgi:hypothetical protein